MKPMDPTVWVVIGLALGGLLALVFRKAGFEAAQGRPVVVGACGRCGGRVLSAALFDWDGFKNRRARPRCEDCGAHPDPFSMSERRKAPRPEKT